ncbi:MAG: hypothetical protein AAB257_09730, partial [Nitrospinota bacterium]
LIKEAARVGANAVKFQNYRTEDFLFDGSLKYTYLSVHNEVFAIVKDAIDNTTLEKHLLCKPLGPLFKVR